MTSTVRDLRTQRKLTVWIEWPKPLFVHGHALVRLAGETSNSETFEISPEFDHLLNTLEDWERQLQHLPDLPHELGGDNCAEREMGGQP